MPTGRLSLTLTLIVSLVLTSHIRAQLATVPTQLGVPTVTTLVPGGTATIDLRPWLGVPGVNGQVMQFDTVRGTFNVELLANDAPRTVANFQNYVNRGAYTNSIFHRSVRGFVIQGGGFAVSGNSVSSISADGPVLNEYKISNIRGTLAMAKTGEGPNTATNQWFVNLGNNSANLDNQNGGFTVFARVLGNGMTVADAIAALTTTDASPQLGLGDTFKDLPVLGLPVTAANLVVVRGITAVPIYPTNTGDVAVVRYSGTNTNAGVVTGSIAGSTLTLTGISAGAARVTVRITDSNGSAAEAVFPVTVAATAPVITGQPLDAVIAAGQTLALNVTATGTGLSYQWKRIPDVAIAGANGPQLIVDRAGATDAGIYFCTVANSAGTRDSAGATVAVRATGVSRLANLSVRANLAEGQLLIVGFSTNGRKDLLVRGVGPKLAAFGLANVYADPRLEIYDGAGGLGATNDNWADALKPTFDAVGAFPLDSGSKDAALVTPVSGGATAQLKGSGSGFVLVEVYDAAAGSTARLTNVSARNRVGSGGDVLIAGLNIAGPVAKTLLIRGVGPKLATFGVVGALVDPKLEIYNSSGTKLAENDNWNATVGGFFAGLGAFPLDAGSTDAALLITLPPGGYTAQLSGADGGTGTGLIEIYELP